jgi:hypothetical protein
MSFGGKSTTVYTPTPAPIAPSRTSDGTVKRMTFNQYKAAAIGEGSYTQGILGGGAPSPTKSYAAALYGVPSTPVGL